MKRTCNNCRAFTLGNGYFKLPECELGHKIVLKSEVKRFDVIGAFLYKPIEECSKPTTWEAYWTSIDNKMQNNTN